MFDILKDKTKVKGFIVSRKEDNPEIIDENKVFQLDEVMISKNEAIVVAVSDQNIRNDITNLLYKRGVASEQIYNRTIDAVLRTDGKYFLEYYKLDNCGFGKGTDKSCIGHNYLGKYEFFLKKWEEEKFTLLELGVFRGASLAMWSDYFINAEIYGVDIDEECLKYEGNRKHIIISDLSDEKVLAKLRNLKPTIIVDDASHFWSHQNKGIINLFDCLPSGGVYILEDLETSFGNYRIAS